MRTDLKELGIYTRNCIDLAQDSDYWRAFVMRNSTSGFYKSCNELGVQTNLISEAPKKKLSTQ